MLLRTALCALTLGVVACRRTPALSSRLAAELGRQTGAHLTGELTGLVEFATLEDRDFVYALAFSSSSNEVAFTHLREKMFNLSAWRLDPLSSRFDVGVGSYEMDVEALALSPNGEWVAVASRGGAVALFDAKTGERKRHAPLGEPWVSMSVDPSGRHLVVGGARGIVTVLTVPGLEPVFEDRLHTAEVRAIAFAPDGRMFSGGWDKTLVQCASVERSISASTARLPLEREGTLLVLRVRSPSGRILRMAVDERVGHSAVRPKAFGQPIEPSSPRSSIATPLGSILAPMLSDVPLGFGVLTMPVDLAACDACVPSGVDGVLGASFAARMSIQLDEVAGDIVLTLRQEAPPPRTALVLEACRRVQLDGYVNDLSLDARGTRVGLALSAKPAQRTKEIYQREKKGIWDEPQRANAGALFDAQALTEISRWSHHRGIVSTAAVSPDGRSLVTGGWDKRLFAYHEGVGGPISTHPFGWSVRRARFSPDGRYVGVAAWTPANPLGDEKSDPAAVVFHATYREARVVAP